MIQCSESHLFCSSCLRSYASTLLGTHNPNIRCLDRDGCTASIPESELRRFLPDEMMRLWERTQQRSQIQAANLKGLEDCPFCDFSIIIESTEDKLLRCRNEEECGVVSCRMCKKPVSAITHRIHYVIQLFICCRLIYPRIVMVCSANVHDIMWLVSIIRYRRRRASYGTTSCRGSHEYVSYDITVCFFSR